MASNVPIRASTQENLDIDDIYDDLILLKNGGAALVIQTTAVNFGLLSETEQDSIIYAYAGLLNSLSFPMQIVVRSKRMDVSSYLESLIKWEQKQVNEKIREQIRKYREFIASTIRENNVLDKRFYLIIPMFPEEVGISPISPIPLGQKSKKPTYPKEYILEKAKNSLLPKRDHLIRQLTRLGLKSTQLKTQQLIELFYDIYNPSEIGSQRLATKTNEYLTPMVTSLHPSQTPSSPKQKVPDQDKLASGFSPQAVLEDIYGKTPVQQEKLQEHLPKTNFQQNIQNTNTPWPTVPNPQIQNTQPFNAGIDVQVPKPTAIPTPNAQPNPSPEAAIQNLQKAIEDAKKQAGLR